MSSLRLFAVLACALACRPTRSTGAIEAPLRPAELTYRMIHQGDHQPWRGLVHVAIDRAAAQRWRRTHRIEPIGSRPITITGVALIGDGPAQVESSGVWDGEESRLVWNQRAVVGETRSGATVRPIRVDRPARLALDFEALDVALPLLPIEPGYRTRLWLLDQGADGWSFRPFALAVSGPETIDVPAGTFSSLRVSLSPLDGNRRMEATFHLQAAAPHVVVRKEYLVNPESRGPIKRSRGVEELASIRWRTGT